MDPSGTALEVKSGCWKAVPQRPEERLPVGKPLCLLGQSTGQGGSVSIWAGKLLLARVQQITACGSNEAHTCFFVNKIILKTMIILICLSLVKAVFILQWQN